MKYRLVCVVALLAGCAGQPEPKAVFGEKKTKTASHAQQRETLFIAKRLSGDVGQLAPRHREKMRRQIALMPRFSTRKSGFVGKSASDQADNRWQWLGPGNAGGRTRTLIFHPHDPNIMFAGGVSGGVWKSTNGGADWQPLSDVAANVNVGALAIHPAEPNTLYVGTGELYRRTARAYAGMAGEGIFKSIDGGQTWVQLPDTALDGFRYVSDIVISPGNPKVLYAATDSGIWRSRDAGLSFQSVLSPRDDQGNLLYEGCTDLALRDDTSRDHLLASCSSRSLDDRYYLPGLLPSACEGPCPARVYLNTDANSSNSEWQVVLSEAGMGRTQMAIHQANPDIVYALAASIVAGPDRDGDGLGDYNNALHAVFRSDDGGLNWAATTRNDDPTKLNSMLLTAPYGAFTVECDEGDRNSYYGAGWYDQALSVDPLDPDRIWVGGIQLFRSDDGGKNWGLLLLENESHVYGGDMHVVRFHPDYDGVDNQTVYAASDAGIYRTSNANGLVLRQELGHACPQSGGVEIEWQVLNNNFGVTQFYAGAAFPDGKTYMAGAQDVGNWIGNDSDGPNNWRLMFRADGGYMAIDPRDNDRIYATGIGATIGRSEDRGQTWAFAGQGIDDLPIVIMPFAMDPNEPDRLWAAGTRLWRTDNRGQSWHAASAPLSVEPVPADVSFPISTGSASSIAISPHDSNIVLVGNREGIYRHDSALSGDQSHALVPMQAPRSGWVSSLSFDPIDAQVAYATYSTYGGEHVWKSTDQGQTWQAIDGTDDARLPDFPVHKLVVDPNNTQRLFLGTEMGVFVSLDGGRHWNVENTGFSNVIVEFLDLSQDTDGNATLFAFTYGRGAWRVPLTDLNGIDGFVIEPGVSGSWYNPEQDGHGLILELIEQGDQQQLLAFWFTYLDGAPVWMTGLGEVSGGSATISMQVASRGQFPPHFDAAQTQLNDWGELTIRFSGPDSARLSWIALDEAYGTGAIALQRLTDIGQGSTQSNHHCYSGAFYDPAQSGHGFILEAVHIAEQPHLLAYWFVYVDGKPLWLVGAAPMAQGRATIPLIRTAGGAFPPLFDPAQVVRTPWGELTVAFTSFDQGQASWQPSLEGFEAGTMPLTRLTRVAGHQCEGL